MQGNFSKAQAGACSFVLMPTNIQNMWATIETFYIKHCKYHAGQINAHVFWATKVNKLSPAAELSNNDFMSTFINWLIEQISEAYTESKPDMGIKSENTCFTHERIDKQSILSHLKNLLRKAVTSDNRLSTRWQTDNTCD